MAVKEPTARARVDQARSGNGREISGNRCASGINSSAKRGIAVATGARRTQRRPAAQLRPAGARTSAQSFPDEPDDNSAISELSQRSEQALTYKKCYRMVAKYRGGIKR